MLFDSIFSIFDKHLDKLKNPSIYNSDEQTCDNNLKIQNLGSHSESCNSLTNVVETCDQYNKVILLYFHYN